MPEWILSVDIFPNDRHIPNARGSSGNWENEPMSEVTRMSLAKIEADDVCDVCFKYSDITDFPSNSLITAEPFLHFRRI